MYISGSLSTDRQLIDYHEYIISPIRAYDVCATNALTLRVLGLTVLETSALSYFLSVSNPIVYCTCYT